MVNDRAISQSAPLTVLIVDENVISRTLLLTLLLPVGYNIITAASTDEALTQIETCTPDLILLDIVMPRVDGLQLAIKLKGSAATSDVPIVLVTALPDRDARIAGMNAGAEDLLTKPVDSVELLLRVRNLLRLKVLASHQKAVHAEIRPINSELEERVLERTQQLDRSNQELEFFSYSVAHDLRGPLTSLAGFSGLLASEIALSQPTERAQHCITRIQANVAHMGRLVDGLLSMAKIGRKALQRQSVDLSALAETAISTCRERQPGQAVQVEIESDLVVQADPTLLQAVLDNLLGNEWKFSSRQEQAKIEFRCEKIDGLARVFSVSDNGVGFDMAHADKLFTAFQSLHSPSDFPSVGVGLATVRKVIELHGGTIWAKAALGQGATFYFTLDSLPIS